MLTKILGRLAVALIAVAAAVAAIAAFVEWGSFRPVFAVLAGILGAVILRVATNKRRRALARAGIEATALVVSSEVVRDAVQNPQNQRQLCEVGLLLEISARGLQQDPAVYRIFRLPLKWTEHITPGSRVRIRHLPDDLSILQVLDVPPAEPGKQRYLEARLSQIPLSTVE